MIRRIKLSIPSRFFDEDEIEKEREQLIMMYDR
jgi:hypothetical protein